MTADQAAYTYGPNAEVILVPQELNGAGQPSELEPAAASDGDGRELLERGRYAITRMPDGSWVINRATPICGNCQACGCGEPQDPIPVPAMVVSLITMDPEKRAKLGPIGAMKRLIGGG